MGPFHLTAEEKLPPGPLRALQAARLRALLDSTSSNKFYKAHFKAAGIKPNELAELPIEKLPFLTKAQLIADQAKAPPFGSNLSFPLTDYSRFHHSSGSTGAAPLRWLDTAESWEWMLRSWSLIFSAAGLKSKDRICFAFSFGPFLGFWTAFDAAARFGALCLPAGGMSTTARLRFMLDNGITVICCTPTYALRMAEAAAEEKVNISLSPVRMLIVAGEPGGSVPAMRTRIEDAWGAKCIDHYGMTETGPATFACEKVPGRMHVIESEFIAECVDLKTGALLPDREAGELVLTNLGRTGMPVIRYRTGDLVKLSRPGVCACGRAFAALDGGILSRADDMLIVRGVNVYPSAIEEVLHAQPIVEFRVEVSRVREMTELRILIEAEPGENAAALAKKIAAEIDRKLGIRVPVEPAPPGTLPRFEMKARRFVST